MSNEINEASETEEQVVQDFSEAGVEAVLVALDLETTAGTPPCSNDFVSGMQKINRTTCRKWHKRCWWSGGREGRLVAAGWQFHGV